MKSLLARINTHRTFWIGMGAAIGSVAVIGAQHQLDGQHLSTAMRIVRFWVDGLAPIAWTIVTPAIIAAGLGRPTTVK